MSTNILEVLKQVGNSFTFAIGEDGFVEAISGSPWDGISVLLLHVRGNPGSVATSAACRTTDTHGGDSWLEASMMSKEKILDGSPEKEEKKKSR